MKKFVKILLLLICLAAIVWFAVQYGRKTAGSDNGGAPESSTEVQPEEEKTEPEEEAEVSEEPEKPMVNPMLDPIREEMGNADCAVFYLGYAAGGTAAEAADCITASPLSEAYPFLKNIDASHTLEIGGGDVYCVVPKSDEASLAVCEMTLGDDGKEKIGDFLYQGDGQPILLICNVSDIMPNCLVKVVNGDNTLEFSPFISLRDGSLTVQPETDRVYLVESKEE